MNATEHPSRLPVQILIAEDSLTQAKRLGHILERQGYCVTHAPNGRLALEAAQRQKPTLIISDIIMPEMDGYELCRRVKADARLGEIPVILVTTLSDPGDVIRGLECRADNFILKPYDEHYLLGRVQFVLLNRQVMPAERATMGVEVFFNGQRHFITADRLQILNLLLSTYDAAIQRTKELSHAQSELLGINQSLSEANRRLEQEIRERERAEQALRTSEENLAVTLQSIGDAVLATDAEGRVTRLNAVAETLSGWTQAEAAGRPVADVFRVINADTRKPASIPVADTLATGTIQGLAGQTVLIARDGTERPVADSCAPIRNRDGAVIGAVLVFRDVTEETRLTRALRASEAYNRSIVESSPDSLKLLSLDARLVHMTPVGCRLWEVDDFSSLENTDWISLWKDGDQAMAQRAVEAARTGGRGRFQGRCPTLKGSPRWWDVAVTPILDAAGQPEKLLAVARDITEQKVRDEALRESELRLRSILDNLVPFVGEMSPDGVLTEVNCTVLKISGRPREELIGRRLDEISLFAHSPAVQTQLREDIERGQRGETVRHDVSVCLADGTLLPVDFMLVPVQDADGRVVKLIPSGVDITERTRSEEALRRVHDDLRRANTELAQASRLKDEFLANMSHELRTPLNAILGLSEALLEDVAGTLTPRQLKSITIISQSGQHLLALINDILDLSKIEAGKLELNLDTVHVPEFCESCLVFVRTQAMHKQIGVAFEPDGNVAKFSADPKRLRQVLVNLLTNAVKFTPEGGRIGLKVAAVAGEDMVRFTVWDTGIGIAAADQQRLFRAFTQIDSGLARAQEGTGLGLALVAKLIELHGGSVALESEPGKGSRFIVTLPLSARPWPAPAPKPAPPGEPDRRSYRRAMIIEDDPTSGAILKNYLTELGLRSVLRLHSEKSLEAVLREQPDVVLLDILMPNENGWVVLAKLKEHPGTRDIPVVVVSVVDEPAKSRAFGAAAHFTKPVTRDQLAVFLQRPAHPKAPRASRSPFKDPASGPSILLAEDNEANIETTGGYLEDKGYTLRYAPNGLLAVQLARELRPALILMDIQMPVMDGLTAIREIRADATLQEIPIVALTALAMPGDRERCLAAGATDYLSKPVSLKALAALVKRLLSSAGDGI